MTVRQWLAHLWQWLCSIPTFSDEPHCYVGLLGSGELACVVCGRTMQDEDEDEA